jgi:hypothetical protein
MHLSASATHPIDAPVPSASSSRMETALLSHWHASHVPPFRIASMLQAFFSASE